MRILIKDSANNQTVLCDGPGRGTDLSIGPLDGVSFDDQVVAQISERFRADAIVAYNRKNKRTSVVFKIARESTSLNAAHVWQMTFHSTCIRAGTVEFSETNSSGVTVTVSLANALIIGIKTTPLGVTRIVEFSIIGGALS